MSESLEKISGIQNAPRKLDLPVELVLHVLKHANSMSDVSAMTRTAPIFNMVWVAYVTEIHSAVLTRSIECYSEALELYNTFQRLTKSEPEGIGKRHQRLLSAARCAASVRDLYVAKHISTQYRLRDYIMTDRERQSFTRAIYYLWNIVLTAGFTDSGLPEPYPLLEFEDTLPVFELTIWISLTFDAPLGILMRKTHEVYTPTSHIPSVAYERWRDCCSSVGQSVHACRQRSAFLKRGLGKNYRWEGHAHLVSFFAKIRLEMRRLSDENQLQKLQSRRKTTNVIDLATERQH